MSTIERYVEEMGAAAFLRQEDALHYRCKYCWAPQGKPHSSLCPEAEEEPEPVRTGDQPALF